MILLWIFITIIIFFMVILVHEFGHFSAARFFWVKVEEFGFWIPPKLKTLFKDKKWTVYTLNLVPLWGFVKLTWETISTFEVYDKNKKLYNNLDLERDIKSWKDIFNIHWNKLLKVEREEILQKLIENNASYNLSKKPAWQQSIILLVWVFMNFLLAFFVFFILFLVWVKPIWINDKIETNLKLKLIPTYEEAIESWLLVKYPWLILRPIEWNIAESSGLQVGDILFEIWVPEINENWQEELVRHTMSSPDYLVELLWKNIWKTLNFYVNSNINEKIISVKIPENWKIWTYLTENISLNENFKYKYWVLNSAKFAFIETKNEIFLTFKWIWYIIKKIFNPKTPEERQDAINSMNWPIWIVSFVSSSMKAWIVFLVIFWAIISISLWVFNLLPIPALDWGRFLFVLINATLGKLFWKKIVWPMGESIIHFIFFILLIILSIFIAYNDIVKIING